MCDAPLEPPSLPTTVHFCPPQGPFLLSKNHFSSYFFVDQRMQRRFRVRRASRAVILAHHGPSSIFAHQGPFLPTEVCPFFSLYILCLLFLPCFGLLLLLPCFCHSVFAVVFLPWIVFFCRVDRVIMLSAWIVYFFARTCTVEISLDRVHAGDGGSMGAAHTTHEQTETRDCIRILRTHALLHKKTNVLPLSYL